MARENGVFDALPALRARGDPAEGASGKLMVDGSEVRGKKNGSKISL